MNPIYFREDPLRWFASCATRLQTKWITGTYPFASVGHDVWIHYSCKIVRSTAHRMHIGDRVVIGRNSWLSAQPGPDDELALVLENGCVVGPRCELAAKNCIHLERDVLLAPSVLMMDWSHGYEDITRPVKVQGETPGGTIRIGEGSWIGHSAAIVCTQGELRLGRNCVVAAHAFVNRSFPPYCVIAGNPARIVRQYDLAKGEWVMGAAQSPALQSSVRNCPPKALAEVQAILK